MSFLIVQPVATRWRKRATLITYTPPDSHGGVERQIQSVLESAHEDDTFEVSILRPAIFESPFLLAVARLFLQEIRGRHSLLDQSILDCQEFSGLPLIILGKLRRKSRPAFLVHCHGPLIRELKEMPVHQAPPLTKYGRIISHALLTIMEWISAREADMVACSSSDSADIVSSQYGVARGKCLAFPKGINPLVFSASSGPEASHDLKSGARREFILFVGRVEPRKRVLELLQWFVNSSLSQETTLVMVGPRARGRYAVAVNDLVRRAGPRVRREIEISDLELHRFYATAGCLVMSSWSEGEGIVALEAIASGCPVVCPKPIAELLRRDFPGMDLIDFSDWSELSGAVDRAIGTSISERRRNAEYPLAHATWEDGWRLLKRTWLQISLAQVSRHDE